MRIADRMFMVAGLWLCSWMARYQNRRRNRDEHTARFTLHCSCWQEAPNESLILLHAYAHNSTGLDHNERTMVDYFGCNFCLRLYCFADSECRGFASYDLDRDANSIRQGVERLAKVSWLLFCQNFWSAW